MKSIKTIFIFALLSLAACVTINIYFPAVEAREAAEKIVDDILGNEAPKPAPGKNDQSMDFRLDDGLRTATRSVFIPLLDLLIPPAEAAAPKFDADSPEVRRLQASMKQRHARLKGFYTSGAIGFTQDALVGIRDLAAASLKQRGELKNLVKAENGDRNRLYKEIARVNGHPEWEKDVRATFGKTWIGNAAPGWWYQNAKGAWVQKRP